MLALLATSLALGAIVAAVFLVRNGEKQSVREVREVNPVSAEVAETTQPPLSRPRASARKVVYEYACAVRSVAIGCAAMSAKSRRRSPRKRASAVSTRLT